MKACSLCRHFDVQPWMRKEGLRMLDENGRAIHKGYCRKSTPTCRRISPGEYDGVDLIRWPIVLATDWCGNFGSRKESNDVCHNGSHQPETAALA